MFFASTALLVRPTRPDGEGFLKQIRRGQGRGEAEGKIKAVSLGHCQAAVCTSLLRETLMPREEAGQQSHERRGVRAAARPHPQHRREAGTALSFARRRRGRRGGEWT